MEGRRGAYNVADPRFRHVEDHCQELAGFPPGVALQPESHILPLVQEGLYIFDMKLHLKPNLEQKVRMSVKHGS